MSIVLEEVIKRFGDHTIVDRVSLEIQDSELFVLLGASGSGKTTILRIIAGLVQPDGGKVLLKGRDVTWLAPQQRGTGFVFQNYSIFRHMNVAQNIEFGLKIRKVAAAERKRKSDQLLEMVGLTGLGNRYASQLSGGQQQRVALARALAYEPEVLLLDEPFGALDVKIRAQLRRSLKEIQRSLGVTTILVTHDQEEAFELADRIGVLERGQLLEVGEGDKLYREPKTLSVAAFLGAGNVLVGMAQRGRAQFGPISLPIPDDVPHDDGSQVQLLIRPEQVKLLEEQPESDTPVLGKARVMEKSFAGAAQRLRLKLPHIPGVRQIAPPTAFGEEGLILEASIAVDDPLPNSELWAALRGWHILAQPRRHLLVIDSGSGTPVSLEIGAFLARRMDASATVLAVGKSPESAGLLEAALNSRMAAAGLDDARAQIRHGNVAEQVCSEAAESVYEMLITTPQVQRFSDRDGATEHLGATLVKILKRVPIPVLVVKGSTREISRILICTAVGEPGKHDVTVGGRLARLLAAGATLLYVSQNPDHLGKLVSAHLEKAATTLREMDVPAEVRIRRAGSPQEGILEEARAGDYDLIVVGGAPPKSRRFSRLRNITSAILAGADRPVLVVPASMS
jgi:ABC-type Fe3+/spermidine/putrescine transport system ATPase subunit/nucleotide-binding universal stress UspA family protein